MKKIGLFSIVFALACLFAGCAENLEAIRRSQDIPKMISKAFQYFDKKEYDKAQVLFEDVMPHVKADSIGEKVYFNYAWCNYYQNAFTLSSHYFKQFYTYYPNSWRAEEALFMSAYSLYRLSPVYRLDQSDTEKAIEAFQLFTNSFPLSQRVSEANKLIDEMRDKLEEKAFETAYLYFKIRDYKAALFSFERLLIDYPGTTNLERIRFMLIKSGYRLAVNSVEEKQKERYDKAVEYYYDFIGLFPKSKYKIEAQQLFDNCVKGLDKLKSLNN